MPAQDDRLLLGLPSFGVVAQQDSKQVRVLDYAAADEEVIGKS